MFAAVQLTRNGPKRNVIKSYYGKKFNRSSSWSLDNEFAQNVVTVGVGNSSSWNF